MISTIRLSALALMFCMTILALVSCGGKASTTATVSEVPATQTASDVDREASWGRFKHKPPTRPAPCTCKVRCVKPLPGMVNILSCSMGNLDNITLRWRAVPHADGYEIWRRADIEGYTWEHIATVSGTEYCDRFNLEECVRYEYKIRAFNCKGKGEFCAVCVGWIGMNPDDCDEEPECPDPCGPCKGKVTELTLRWNGAGTANVVVTGKKKDSGTIFSGTVNPGGTFSFSGQDKDGTLGTEIIVSANGQSTNIHTSCSKPIGVGMNFGPYTVMSGASRTGGALCPPGGQLPRHPDCPDPGGDCKGGVNALTLQWLGSAPAHIVVSQNKKMDKDIVFSGNVPAGGNFSFTGLGKDGKLKSNTHIFVNGQASTSIHTSCSQLIGRGQTWGQFLILDGSSVKGGRLPEVGGVGGKKK